MTTMKAMGAGAIALVLLALYIWLLVVIATGGDAIRECRDPIEHAYLQQGYAADAAERMARIECR